MIKVGLYPRVSTQEQTEGYSINEQISRMEKYCDAMGWKVYNVYTDAGFSGANTNRPGLQNMIKDVKAGRIDKVLVYKLDRLSRSQKDTLELIEDVFLANNAEFVSMNENFDTSTPFGRAMIGILAVFAQLEREQIKERMSMGQDARAKEGKYSGNQRTPIGYNYINGELVVNEFEKMQVIKAFKMCAAGVSLNKITATLNNAGEIHKFGEWTHQTVRRVLKSKIYIGYILFRGKHYKGIHEVFIDEDLFNTVQLILEKKREDHEKYNRRPGKASSYLAGYMYCNCCGAKYAKKVLYKKKVNGDYSRYERYMCYSKIKTSPELIKNPNCKNKNWNMKTLDNLVFDEIKKLAIDPEYIHEVKESTPEDKRPKTIQTEIKKIDNQISKLMDLYVIGNMPVDVLQNKVHALNEQKEKLELEIEKIIAENETKLSHEEATKLIQSFPDVLKHGDFNEIRAVIGGLIEKIVINGEDITIHWKF